MRYCYCRSVDEIIDYLQEFVEEGVQVIASFDLTKESDEVLKGKSPSFSKLETGCKKWIKNLESKSTIVFIHPNKKETKINFLLEKSKIKKDFSKGSGLSF